jgi:hypothetical protein
VRHHLLQSRGRSREALQARCMTEDTGRATLRPSETRFSFEQRSVDSIRAIEPMPWRCLQ